MSKVKLRMAELQDKRRRFYNMVLSGISIKDAAEALGMGIDWGYQTYHRCFDAAKKDREGAMETIKDLELARVDKLMSVWYPRACGGTINGITKEPSEKALNATLSLLDRRSRYLGLDAPTKAAVEVTQTDIVRRELIDKIPEDIQRMLLAQELCVKS